MYPTADIILEVSVRISDYFIWSVNGKMWLELCTRDLLQIMLSFSYELLWAMAFASFPKVIFLLVPEF